VTVMRASFNWLALARQMPKPGLPRKGIICVAGNCMQLYAETPEPSSRGAEGGRSITRGQVLRTLAKP
jgi:hypothetical protein